MGHHHITHVANANKKYMNKHQTVTSHYLDIKPSSDAKEFYFHAFKLNSIDHTNQDREN